MRGVGKRSAMTAPKDGGGSAETINAKIPTGIGPDQREIEARIKAKLGTGEAQPQQITAGKDFLYDLAERLGSE